MRLRWHAGRLGFIAALLGACAGTPAATYPPLPTFPVPAEVLAVATAGPSSIEVTCGDGTFPLDALDNAVGAEEEVGPLFDGLRETLETYGEEFPGSETWSWRLVLQEEAMAEFMARTDDLGPPGWVNARVVRRDDVWRSYGMGQCDPKVVLSAEYGPASWALDPAFAAPGPDTTELHILVWERSCSGGAPATGRIAPPAVLVGTETVTITLGVRPIEVPPGFAITCPGPPGTPAILHLPEPLGSRQLLDGGSVPPAPPKPMFGP